MCSLGNKFNYPANLNRHVKINHNYSVGNNKKNKREYYAEPPSSIVALHQHLLEDHPKQVQDEREYLARDKHEKIRIQRLLESEDISMAVYRARYIERKGMIGEADPLGVLLYVDHKELCLIPIGTSNQELDGNLMNIHKDNPI